jgi:hypothetical protein
MPSSRLFAASSLLVLNAASLLCASAFLHASIPPSPLVHHTIHQSSSTAAEHHYEPFNDSDSTIEEISQTLQSLQKHLLANPEKLQPILSQHLDNNSSSFIDGDDDDSHREATPYNNEEQLVKETLLSTRLSSLELNRTSVGPSTIEGAGLGLFATEDIAKGDLITCYPGDALLVEYGELEIDEDEYNDDHNFDDEELDFEDEEYYNVDESDYVEEAVLWGSHVNTTYRMDEDTVFDGSFDKEIPPLTSYAASVDDVYSVMGHPSLDDNPAYFGHFANDGAGHIALQSKVGDCGGIEEIISSYVSESLQLSNARHVPISGGLHLGTVATKDIKNGEEVFVTYGPGKSRPK